MSPEFEIQLIAVIVAVACALPGTFLLLRKMSMMSDAITHTILLGIVLGFFVTRSLTSPLLIAGAALIGLVTVWLVEFLAGSRYVSEDSAIGFVFPLLFSIAIILISRYAGSVHLDTDSVLLGELAFAPFDRMVIWNHDVGTKAAWSMGVILIINLTVLVLFFKEIKLATFDPITASLMGFSPALLHYGLMTSVSLTAVGAFQAVGSVLVVAFMIGPPAAAYLLTDDLKKMLILGAAIGCINALLGYQLAAWLDISIAGSIAVMTGLVFTAVFVLSPSRGLLSHLIMRARQRVEFAKATLMLHLQHHENTDDEEEESGTETIHLHLKWSRAYCADILRRLEQEGRVQIENGIVKMRAGEQYRQIRQPAG